MKARKYFRFILIVLITIGIFIYIFSIADYTQVLSSVRNAKISLVFLCLGISFICNIMITSYRWKLILKQLGCLITFNESLIMKMGGNALVKILPFRSGEFSRMLHLKHLKGMPFAKSTFSIAVEYLLNFLILILFCSIGVILYYIRGTDVVYFSKYNLLIGYLMPFCFIASSWPDSINSVMKTLWNIIFVDFLVDLRVILLNKNVIFCTLMYMGGEFINLFLLSKALLIHIPLYAIMLITPFVILGSHLLITLAGLGTRELTVAVCFAAYAPPEQLVSLGILLSFVEVIFPLCFGFLFVTTFTSRLALSISGENSEYN